MTAQTHQNQSETPGQSRSLAIALFVALAAFVCIGWNIFTDLNGRFLSDYPQRVADHYARCDSDLKSQDRGDGVYLQFDGFKGPALGYLPQFYFRAVYLLFPEKVLVGDAAFGINTAPQIAEINGTPTLDWLLGHDVHSIVTIRYLDNSIYTAWRRIDTSGSNPR